MFTHPSGRDFESIPLLCFTAHGRIRSLLLLLYEVMKRFFLSTLFIAMTCAVPSAFAQQAIKITPIEELSRKMEPSLFAAADQNIVKKYLPTDGAPASMSSFVLFAGEEAILIDTGLGGAPWQQKLAESGVKPENVKLILLTHLHGDHIGGLLQGNARRFPQAKVLCSAPEYEYWQSKREGAKITDAYGKDFSTFKYDDQVFANDLVNVKALGAPGHTPGHTAFLISRSSGAVECLIIGDLLHAAALQFPAPEICTAYDSDPVKAVASRKRLLDYAAQENIPIAGMHLPAPHIGKVKKNDNGGYVWQ